LGSVAAVADLPAQSGLATVTGDLRVRTTTGNIVVASHVSAGDAPTDMAIIAAGNATENPPARDRRRG